MASETDRVALYSVIDPFPAPRGNRTPAFSEAESGALSLRVPQVTNWAFHTTPTLANVRSTVASRRLVGEVLLDELTLSFGTSTRTSPPCQFFIYYNGAPYAEEQNVAAATAMIGTNIFEYEQAETAVTEPSVLKGTDHIFAGNALTPHPIKLRRPIRLSEVYLAVGVVSRAAGAIAVHGHIRILENVDPSTMGELLIS